tara:strand:- start:2053 stop:2784 length:732 start_codon:yes stop_codon:yes gene_type:complete
MAKEIKKIGDILIKRKYITKKQLTHALAEQGDKPLGQTLIDMGYVKEHEIAEALEEQSLLKQTLDTAKDAVANPIQYKALWFIVVFSILGIIFIYSQITGTVDEGIKENSQTNVAQDEDINAVSVKEKKLRLRYIGHNSKLNELQDTTKQIKKRNSAFKRDVASEFKGTNEEIDDLRMIMFDSDSVLNENLSDLDDRFFTYRSTSKNNINRLKKENKALKERVDELELKLNDIESKLKKDEEK